MNKIFFSALLACFCFHATAQDIQLPSPEKTGGMPLMDALSARHTDRHFSEKELSQQTLSNLLWAAYGFNRPDKRVVPSSQNRQEIDVYITLKEGVYFYDAKANQLILKEEGDHRKSTGSQDFVAIAPLNILYVANLDKASNRDAACMDCGFIIQNVYLFCASEDLISVARGYFDKSVLHQLLDLNDTQEVMLTQTVGYKQ